VIGYFLSIDARIVVTMHDLLLASRDENGRKRSENIKTVTVFIFFIRNEIENGNSGNGNDIGISESSETEVRYKKNIGISRNLKYNR
jgi:hypothetical protein